MIISHRHRFIFIHCRKVAGSSMKVSLAPHLGPDDVMLGSVHESIQAEGAMQPWMWRQLLTPLGISELWSAMLKRRGWASALNKVMKKRFKREFGLSSSSHPPAVEIRDAMPDIWRDYYKFCFVRNPYERAVSDYLYRTRKDEAPPSFSGFLSEVIADARSGRQKHDNWPMYTINDEVAVDFVGRYENLEADFRHALSQVGIEGVDTLSSAKRRTYPKPWQEYYGPEEREKVEQLFSQEIEYFEYSFTDRGASGPQ
ncbi:sulfotransferase family 2 domain-containing protein [Thioalkalivibrio thiocyanoxidans]|uniref:sulfotransferase family 2 domain-containing protein n=1 Tax=Thioalkalivibrio thiocyanoxidans TaxID=152475 RepID=UPI00037873D5|nr:sulfotransferase family 2 domain-containing protein [Thioalkalivibrio thiocyanoxidans]